jgi:hypothetical protein
MPKFSHSKVENNITRKKEISNNIFISFPLHPIQEETKKFLGRSIAMLSTIWILIGGWFVVKTIKSYYGYGSNYGIELLHFVQQYFFKNLCIDFNSL